MSGNVDGGALEALQQLLICNFFGPSISRKTSDTQALKTSRTSGVGWLYSKSNVCNERGIIPTEQELHAQLGVGLNGTLIMDLENKGISLSAESMGCHLQRSNKMMQLHMIVCFLAVTLTHDSKGHEEVESSG